MEMHFESGECATEGCVNANELDNVTIRCSAAVDRLEVMDLHNSPNDFAGIGACASEGGQPGPFNAATDTQFHCFTNLLFETDLHSWVITDFKMFRLTSAGPPPPFIDGPGVFDGGAHPNTVPGTSDIRTVAASVDCRGLPSSAPLRWGMERSQNGPCHDDTEYGITICSPAGKNLNNANYQDDAGATMANDVVFKDVFCPT
jgi:hypothetical protein